MILRGFVGFRRYSWNMTVQKPLKPPNLSFYDTKAAHRFQSDSARIVYASSEWKGLIKERPLALVYHSQCQWPCLWLPICIFLLYDFPVSNVVLVVTVKAHANLHDGLALYQETLAVIS